MQPALQRISHGAARAGRGTVAGTISATDDEVQTLPAAAATAPHSDCPAVSRLASRLRGHPILYIPIRRLHMEHRWALGGAGHGP
jgi:hypothetical protein